MCGISPTHSQRQRYIYIYIFIYLFVDENELLVTWFLVGCFDVRRLGSNILCPVYVSWAAISFFSCCFLLILKIFRVVLLVHKVSRSRFPF